MKKIIRCLLLMLSLSFLSVGSFVTPIHAEDYGEEPIPMWRLYNPNSGEHFYTASLDERDHLYDVGWNIEGIGWYAPAYGQDVYRLYNANGGEHHYTLSAQERDVLVSKGWRYEGVGWKSGGSITLKREYNPNAFSCNHNYTTSVAEHNHLVSLGWKDEGIGWYATEPAGFSIEEDNNATVSVSTDINMTGSGDGYHSKVVMNSANGSLASFGIQYDIDSSGNHGCHFILENIMNHAAQPGLEGKRYLYAGSAQPGKTYNIRLSWYKDSNELVGYVDGVEVIRDKTTFQILTGEGQNFALAIEGDVKHAGDTINATFKHIKARSSIDPKIGGILYGWDKFAKGEKGLHIQVTDPGKGVKDGAFDTGESNSGYDASIHIYGKGDEGIAGHDWDWIEFLSYASATTHAKLPGQATSAQTRTVTFDPGEDATISPKTMEPVACTDIPEDTLPVPVKTGYQFEGWYTVSDPAQMNDSTHFIGKMITDNITVYAKWERKTKATVSFNKNCEDDTITVPGNRTIETDSQIGELPVLERNGYTFDGWYDQPDGGNKMNPTSVINDDVTLYARWTQNSEPAETPDPAIVTE